MIIKDYNLLNKNAQIRGETNIQMNEQINGRERKTLPYRIMLTNKYRRN